MFKKIILSLLPLLIALGLAAQNFSGGVKGTVVSRADKAPVSKAEIVLYSAGERLLSVTSSTEGEFFIKNLKDGIYELVITAPDFLQTKVNVTVNDGYIKNMFRISMTPEKVVAEVDDFAIEVFNADDAGYNDSPVVLFGQNDVFNNIAGFNFSNVRFRARGYSSESQEVLLAGVKMNDALTGYAPYSLWSGLNEATRTKYSVTGIESSDYGLGGYNGLTNIPAGASNVRRGARGSVLTNSALYRLRLMMTYASGPSIMVGPIQSAPLLGLAEMIGLKAFSTNLSDIISRWKRDLMMYISSALFLWALPGAGALKTAPLKRSMI